MSHEDREGELAEEEGEEGGEEMRKPRALIGYRWLPAMRCKTDVYGRYVDCGNYITAIAKSKELRQVAAWLLKAADWLEGEE